jgi:hypothetical protein
MSFNSAFLTEVVRLAQPSANGEQVVPLGALIELYTKHHSVTPARTHTVRVEPDSVIVEKKTTHRPNGIMMKIVSQMSKLDDDSVETAITLLLTKTEMPSVHGMLHGKKLYDFVKKHAELKNELDAITKKSQEHQTEETYNQYCAEQTGFFIRVVESFESSE